jgi:single-stranded-DNA-specific exonuclease
MTRRPPRRWILPRTPDPAAVAALGEQLRLPEIVCRLLATRGYASPDDAKRFLRPRLEQLHPPSAMAGLDRAVERLVAAVRAGETVLVHGDYDVDGMASTSLLLRTLRGVGGVAVPFIPRRLEHGYDLTEAGVRAAVEAGARVVVTCDCGTTALGPVAQLTRAGIDVIITDHHLPGGPLPDCLAVLNPKQPGCAYPDKDLAAVGVAFKLALGLVRALGASETPVLEMLDLVALATIADIAPLRGENRVFARLGLRLMAQSKNVGLRALIRAVGLEGKPLTAGRVGFILAPRLNAVGRLGDAMRGVELLTTASEDAALRLAREMDETNRKRQELDRATLDQAMKVLDARDLDATFGIVLSDPGWHPGVIGIVASRVVEQTGRPAVLVAVQGGQGKGSGRSVPALDLHAALGECKDLFVRYGGHKAAAGITIAADNIPAFAERFDAVARARLTPDDLCPELRIDADMPLGDASANLEALLRHFEPFGIGNPAPMLMARGLRMTGPPRVLKQDGLKVRLVGDGSELEAIGWGLAPLAAGLDPARPVDVAFRLERDEWNGASRLQANLADIRH